PVRAPAFMRGPQINVPVRNQPPAVASFCRKKLPPARALGETTSQTLAPGEPTPMPGLQPNPVLRYIRTVAEQAADVPDRDLLARFGAGRPAGAAGFDRQHRHLARGRPGR